MVSYEDLTKAVIETKTIKYTIAVKPPHNFYYVSVSKGAPPRELQGAYTTIDAASRDINNYLKRIGKD